MGQTHCKQNPRMVGWQGNAELVYMLVWRAREAKRVQASKRDKERIQALEQQVDILRRESLEWRHWWEQIYSLPPVLQHPVQSDIAVPRESRATTVQECASRARIRQIGAQRH